MFYSRYVFYWGEFWVVRTFVFDLRPCQTSGPVGRRGLPQWNRFWYSLFWFLCKMLVDVTRAVYTKIPGVATKGLFPLGLRVDSQPSRHSKFCESKFCALLQASMADYQREGTLQLIEEWNFLYTFNLNSVSTCNWTSNSPSLTPPQRYSGNTHWGYSYSEWTQSRLFWGFESPSGNGP